MSLSKAEHDELCCVYAGLLLFDDKVEITSEKINKVVTASGNQVDAYYPEFFAKYLSGLDLNSVLNNVGSAPTSTAPVQAATTAKVEEKKDDKKGPPAKDDKTKGKKEEKPKEPEPEPEAEGGFGDLFG